MPDSQSTPTPPSMSTHPIKQQHSDALSGHRPHVIYNMYTQGMHAYHKGMLVKQNGTSGRACSEM